MAELIEVMKLHFEEENLSKKQERRAKGLMNEKMLAKYSISC